MKAERQIFVPPFGLQVFEEWVYRHIFRPEFASEENHGAGESEREVVVLGGVLEDFLESAGAAGGVDDASEREGQEAVFAEAVFEKFCDVGCEGGRGLVAVEPGGDAEALVWPAGVFLHDPVCGREPPGVIE